MQLSYELLVTDIQQVYIGWEKKTSSCKSNPSRAIKFDNSCYS